LPIALEIWDFTHLFPALKSNLTVFEATPIFSEVPLNREGLYPHTSRTGIRVKDRPLPQFLKSSDIESVNSNPKAATGPGKKWTGTTVWTALGTLRRLLLFS